MAGYIHLSSGKGLSISSRSFDSIVEKTREYLGCDNSCTQKIYEPLDEGALHIISLEEQDKEGFNTFYRATILAKTQYVKEKKMTQEELMKLDLIYVSWQELINLLRQDFRYKS